MATKQERLNAISLKFANLQICRECGRVMSRDEEAWCVKRYTPCGTKSYEGFETYYCQKCTKSREEVLEKVDSDSYQQGIAGVDAPKVLCFI